MKTSLLITLLLTTQLSSQSIENKEELCSRWNQSLRIETERELNPEQLKYDVVYYNIDLDFQLESGSMANQLTMRAVILDASIAYIEMDFMSTYVLHDINTVLIDGEPSGYIHDNDLVTIPLTNEYEIGNIIEVSIYWDVPSYPESIAGALNFYEFNGSELIWSLSGAYLAHFWWPCKDHPSDKPDSMDIFLTVPEEYYAISNGSLRATIDNGDNTQTFYWHESYPMATYLFSVNIYPYFVWSDIYVSASNDTMPIMFYSFDDTSDVGDPVENYLKTNDMMEVFAELFCEYPFLEEKYGHAQVPVGGGMEHQTVSLMGGHYEDLVSHELAHQWFGDMISPASFHHMWLNEGFATYAEALWDEQEYGMEAYFSRFGGGGFSGDGTIYIENLNTEPTWDGWLRYEKPAYVLHMLRRVMGDELFFTALRTYAEHPDHKYASATTEDFQEICETVSGSDLEWFFDQWIYGARYPAYTYDWRIRTDDAESIVELRVNQVQDDTGLFKMPIDVEVTLESGTMTHVIQDSLEYQLFEIPTVVDAAQLEFDPNNWVLKTLERVTSFTPYGQNISLNAPYRIPGVDTLILSAEVFNPDSQMVSMSAIIEHSDQNLLPNAQLFDDGTGFDEIASDGIFTGSWIVPDGEHLYNIDLRATTLDSGYSVIKDDLAIFTTAGPLVFGGFPAGTDTSMDPSGSITFQIAVTNLSESFDASYVTAQVNSLDTLFDVQRIGWATFREINAGETVEMVFGSFRLTFSEDYEGEFQVPMSLDIFNEGQFFWNDTFMFNLDVVGLDDELNTPDQFLLQQNYPNPFNPSTTINYSLPYQSTVKLNVFDIQGQEVIKLQDTKKPPGNYKMQWNGLDQHGNQVSTGVYFCRLEAGEFSQTIKMVYLR